MKKDILKILKSWMVKTGTHTFVGLKNFITLFTKDILFFKVMKNTFVYVIAYVALNVVFEDLAALAVE